MLRRQEYVGVLIGAARRRLRQAVSVEARRYGLSAQEFWILIAARELTEASLGELAERQRLELPTASRVVSSLARRELLKLQADREDRRRARISLTSRGRKLADELSQVAGRVRAAVIEGMSAEEQDRLRGGLRKVLDNLERYLTRAGSAALERDLDA